MDDLNLIRQYLNDSTVNTEIPTVVSFPNPPLTQVEEIALIRSYIND